jgi:hypothetical protein
MTGVETLSADLESSSILDRGSNSLDLAILSKYDFGSRRSPEPRDAQCWPVSRGSHNLRYDPC